LRSDETIRMSAGHRDRLIPATSSKINRSNLHKRMRLRLRWTRLPLDSIWSRAAYVRPRLSFCCCPLLFPAEKTLRRSSRVSSFTAPPALGPPTACRIAALTLALWPSSMATNSVASDHPLDHPGIPLRARSDTPFHGCAVRCRSSFSTLFHARWHLRD
jgi:hypothetical protein